MSSLQKRWPNWKKRWETINIFLILMNKGRHAAYLQKAVIGLCLLMMLYGGKVQAQNNKITRFLFLLDCSGSMWGEIDKTSHKQKILVAKAILTSLVDSLKNLPNVELGLREYGANSQNQDCHDTRLEVGFYNDNEIELKQKIARLQPGGTTPIAYSLTQAANDFPNANARNIIILITDGIEECHGDPCAVSAALQARKIVLKPFIIGLGMNSDYSKYFDCVGRYFSAENENEMHTILSAVVSQALNNTTAQVNLNDINHHPTETDVEMTFYNAKTNNIAYDFYHTMNELGRPDTLKIDAISHYNIQVHTTPPVWLNNVELVPAKHNIIDIDAPQGTLSLNVNSSEYEHIRCIVRKSGDNDIVNVQDFNTDHKYIVGSYDLEALTLPRTQIKSVHIDQSKTQTINLPKSGKLEISYPDEIYGSVYVIRSNKQEWVIDINGADKDHRELYYLLPGSYKIVYRSKDANHTMESKDKDFKITSGASTNLKLN
jgi:Ca-activated chloride channel family protein